MNAGILEILSLETSQQSQDYVQNKKQFHLFGLLTEQRHPKTWNLSFALKKNVESGLRMLFDVDRDITEMIDRLRRDPSSLESAVQAVSEAILTGKKIYIYGCGATGRLSKQMESTFWRPFWLKIKESVHWKKLQADLPPQIEEMLIGEMTGGDRALVSALEGFEDLLLIGELQYHDRGVSKGDVVFCVTEGGETSSVIGTILTAAQEYGAEELEESRKRLYFLYNNPDDRLLPFDRSARVLNHRGITKINLTTGPQGITGSTRLQATTSETFVLAMILEQAIAKALRTYLTTEEMAELGFPSEEDLPDRLSVFSLIQKAVEDGTTELAVFTEAESKTYRHHHFTTYYAQDSLITVFIDGAERSPTFRLFPLDRVDEPERKCWFQVWTGIKDKNDSWHALLGRPFRGLKESLYQAPFQNEIEDAYLRQAALKSLTHAGDDQEVLYDFGFTGNNLAQKGPKDGDLAVTVLTSIELEEWQDEESDFQTFLRTSRERKARPVILAAVPAADGRTESILKSKLQTDDLVVLVPLPQIADPLGICSQISLKMLLNAHSTAVMSLLGRVVGNTMTNVSPSNLKLIGRATYLVMTHVNDVLEQKFGEEDRETVPPVSFQETNAVLLDAVRYVNETQAAQTAEVALSIIRMLESLRLKQNISWVKAEEILKERGLEGYLLRYNPRLCG